ncbi:MAG: hypothetical protein WCX32_00850 [Clostridia bacterium]|jgi:hypothetical protein|nr:hypothetical protein [Clostridia bacterium]MDD4275365.1 hypothetical protein [Clostridia bacterium]
MRKIIAIVSIVLVVILATLVTLSLVIKKDYSTSIDLANPDVITVYKNGANLSFYEDVTPNEYSEIIEMINVSSSASYMNAFIKGTMLYESKIETVSTSTLNLTASDKIYIEYKYYALKSLVFNGEAYVNTLTDVEAIYYSVVFEITDTDSMAVTDIYFSDSETTTFYKKYKLTTRMNTAELYNYIDEMYVPA